MKDEIKEILDYLNKFINDKEEITKYGCEISVKDAKLLLDCITNLQEENKELKKKIAFNEKSRRKMQQSLMEQIETYKSRNEKVREMIRFIAYNSERPLTITELNKVYNILGGDDND